MKPSEYMLKGFEMAEGRQCPHEFYQGEDSRNPVAVCAWGAMILGATGDAGSHKEPREIYGAIEAFRNRTGYSLIDLNNGTDPEQNGEQMSIPDIAGILAAEGF